MKKAIFNLAAYATLAFMLLFTACKKDSMNGEHDKPEGQVSVEILNLLECNGFDTKSVQLVDGYINVEGCMLIEESILREMAQYEAYDPAVEMMSGKVENRQYAVFKNSLVAMEKVNNIKYYIDASVTQINNNWKTAIDTACAKWTAIPLCRITFTQVNTHLAADLSFFADNSTSLPFCMRNIPDTLGAMAMFPANNNTGRFISIRRTYAPASEQERLMVATHEIGHALGFRHDNSANESGETGCQSIGVSNKIAGTLNVDGASVMVKSVNNNTLSLNDRTAAQYLYPEGYNTPTILSATASGSYVTLNITPLVSQLPYRLLIARYTTAGTAVQVYEIPTPASQTSFPVNCPTGTWVFKAQYFNYGTYGSALSNGITVVSNGIISGATYKLTHKGTNQCLDVASNSSTPGANVQQWTDNGNNAQRWVVTLESDGFYKLTHVGTNQCLDVANNSSTPGANVQQWTDNGNNAQRWKIEPMPDGSYKLTHKGTNQCLDVANNSSAPGVNIQQWTDNGNNAQRWIFTKY